MPRRRPCPGADRAHARARRGWIAHLHVAGRLPPCAPVCGTRARRRRAAGNTPPPQKQHTHWQPASTRAARTRPRRRRGRARRPRRVADASPLPVDADIYPILNTNSFERCRSKTVWAEYPATPPYAGEVAARENKEGDPPGFHRPLYYSIRGWKVERVPSWYCSTSFPLFRASCTGSLCPLVDPRSTSGYPEG